MPSPTGRGGRLFDPDVQRGERSAAASLRGRIAALALADRELVAAGALTSAVAP